MLSFIEYMESDFAVVSTRSPIWH